jgi:hypothetical protein
MWLLRLYTEMSFQMRRLSFSAIIMALLAAGILVRLVVLHSRPNAKDVARKALAETAGAGFVDCGWSAIGHDRSIQRSCVFNSYQNRTPFIVLYEVTGKEEPGEVGLAGDNNGGIYMLTVESGKSFQELYSKFIKEGKHLTPSACPAPPKLQVIGDGYLLCSWK